MRRYRLPLMPERLKRWVPIVCLGVGSVCFPVMSAHSEPLAKVTTQSIEDAVSHEQAPPPAEIDPITELPDLRVHPAGPERKQAFLELLVPIVEAENARVKAQREWLVSHLAQGASLSSQEASRLASLCDDYGLECSGETIPRELLVKVNAVPLSLVVIQAIEESGWGTSRFARQGNNLFGLRCFNDGCGLAQRGSSRRYAAFDSIQEAVRTYLHNLNTHDSYAPLREQRAQLVKQKQPVTPEALIDKLDGYAVRADYQDVLLALLRTNAQLIESHRSDRAV